MTDIETDIDINLKSRSTFEVVDNDNVIFKVDIDHGRFKEITFEKYQTYYFISICHPALLTEKEIDDAHFNANFFRYCSSKYFDYMDSTQRIS
jgi:hypothetical protein